MLPLVPAPEIEPSLTDSLRSLEDGGVAVVEDPFDAATGDLLCIRAGPRTFHPLKACHLLGDDVVFVSGLKGCSTPPVRDALASAVRAAALRRPRQCYVPPKGPLRGLANACPSLHSLLLDPSMLSAVAVERARMLLAAVASSLKSLPLILIACAPEDQPTGREDGGSIVFLGQREGEEGSFYIYSVRSRSGLEESAENLRVAEEELSSVGGSLRARALFELWGGSSNEGDGLLRGAVLDKSGSPFAHLASEWDVRTHRPKALMAPPAGTCRSILLLGGTAPLSSVSFGLRGDLDALRDELRMSEGRKSAKPLSAALPERQWQLELDILLSGSDRSGLVDLEPHLPEGGGASELRSNLDFTERLWQSVLCHLTTPDQLTSAVRRVFSAVESGSFFPIIHEENRTAIGKHLAEGNRRSQAIRYGGNGSHLEAGEEQRWLSCGEDILAHPVAACMDLGLRKLQGDLIHWFHMEAGVPPAELHWFTGAATEEPLRQRLHRLQLLVDALEAVTLAQNCGTPWQQARAVAGDALRAYSAVADDPDRLFYVFAATLPEAIPAAARARLASPLFWELQAERKGNVEKACIVLPGAEWPSLVPRLSAEAMQAAQKSLAHCGGSPLAAEVLHCLTGSRILPLTNVSESAPSALTMYTVTKRKVVPGVGDVN
jgi:hypothetical protein